MEETDSSLIEEADPEAVIAALDQSLAEQVRSNVNLRIEMYTRVNAMQLEIETLKAQLEGSNAVH